ncbi:MAG: hypothetical protein GC186_08625 [Rhodobacteraceae bacterium]|nr:hypothetical protein [Paracoccaceae bacterium]
MGGGIWVGTAVTRLDQTTQELRATPAAMERASCATNSGVGCAGSKPIRLSGASVDTLAAKDPEALKAMIGHQEFGRAMGCWR